MNEMIPAVKIQNLSVCFGSFRAVDDVTFEVEKGEIFGFLGANGAGKTTTIRVMCGLLLPSKGAAWISGHAVREAGQMVKSKVGYMSQKFTLYDDLTVDENIEFKGAIRKLPNELVRKRKAELFDFIGFSHPGDTLVKNLPSGVKQQLSLAATLLHDPEIIFLDEPTSGVSPSVRKKFWSLIRSLAKKAKTVIVTTHYMDEAGQCGRIALMRAGRLIALDSPSGLKKETYPEPLVEAEISRNDMSVFLEHVKKSPFIDSFWPYGLHYHLVFREISSAGKFFEELPFAASSRFIEPTLEDVFIRLVEGKDR